MDQIISILCLQGGKYVSPPRGLCIETSFQRMQEWDAESLYSEQSQLHSSDPWKLQQQGIMCIVNAQNTE